MEMQGERRIQKNAFAAKEQFGMTTKAAKKILLLRIKTKYFATQQAELGLKVLATAAKKKNGKMF